MADDCVRDRETAVAEFFLNTCLPLRRLVKEDDVVAFQRCLELVATAFHRADDVDYVYIPLITGSVAELCVEPMLPCVGDVDVMCHRSNQLAIPAGCAPPRQLPGEFGSRVEVYEITDSQFPGYVYLWLSYLLTECVDDGEYKAVQCGYLLATNGSSVGDDSRHGPALVKERSFPPIASLTQSDLGLRHGAAELRRSLDNVFCMRCLMWPLQAADWPKRQRNYGWPDSTTVGRIVSNGCDVVGVAHRRCRQDEWMGKYQWRLSFSRAEIVLLNSWIPVQQIVYHMLRVFIKTELPMDSTSDTGVCLLSNYHIKTLILWACELKSRSWWTDGLNLIRICVELLHTLADWLTGARCRHYFINNCKLFDEFANLHHRPTQETANRLMSITRAWFCEWFIDNYVHKCAQLCPGSVSSLLQDTNSSLMSYGLRDVVCLQNMVSEIVIWRLDTSLKMSLIHMAIAQWTVMGSVSFCSLTLRLCLCSMYLLSKTNQLLRVYYRAVVFLHVACKITRGSLTDEMLDVLATTCLQLNDARRCLNARHSSELSLSLAATVMKVVANNSSSTVQLIEIELAKAYLHRALRYEDSNSNSVYCLASVYLAVLYYTTGQYQTTIDHCTLVTRLQDHCQCSSHVVQGEILPQIDDQVDSILGLAVFYQYTRAAALNEERERRHVSVFTTELFAHYLHIKFLSVTKCHQLPHTSLETDDQHHRYQKCLCSSPTLFVTDVILFHLTYRIKCPSDCVPLIADRSETKSSVHQKLNTSKLVELLQQSAVEHLTTCRELEARDLDLVITPDFKAMYAYKCGQYQHCLQLSLSNVCQLILNKRLSYLFLPVLPELMQLMDEEIVSLVGLTALINPSPSNACPLLVFIHQLTLSLYLMTQCQIKLRHSVTSLATSLDYVRFAGFIVQMFKFPVALISKYVRHILLDQPVLKYAQQKISR